MEVGWQRGDVKERNATELEHGGMRVRDDGEENGRLRCRRGDGKDIGWNEFLKRDGRVMKRKAVAMGQRCEDRGKQRVQDGALGSGK